MERLSVRVIPNARRDEVVGIENGQLKVRIRAVPEEGKANRALIAFLAKHCGCRRQEISILSGETARNKVLSVPEAAVAALRSS
jgi:hypothetical protein